MENAWCPTRSAFLKSQRDKSITQTFWTYKLGLKSSSAWTDREHNSAEQIRNCSPRPSSGLTITGMSCSPPWAVLLKVSGGCTCRAAGNGSGTPRMLQSRAHPCRASQAQPPGRAASAPALSRLCPKQALHLLQLSTALHWHSQLSFPHTGSPSARHFVHGGEGVLWAHLPGPCDCVKAPAFLCSSFQHKHIEARKLCNKELYFLSWMYFCPSTTSVTFLSCLNVLRKIWVKIKMTINYIQFLNLNFVFLNYFFFALPWFPSAS